MPMKLNISNRIKEKGTEDAWPMYTEVENELLYSIGYERIER